jgi:hypothetical protein
MLGRDNRAPVSAGLAGTIGAPGVASETRPRLLPNARSAARWHRGFFPGWSGSVRRRPSRAGSSIGNSRGERGFVIRSDGLDHEIERVGAVDLPSYAVVLAWHDDVGFREVIEPVNPTRRVIFMMNTTQRAHSVLARAEPVDWR